ncbi:cation:proton antiporter domain-containing protein [Rathayibacter soli]|uniref:cation:proton antiporter domain-containing protein n=1 Tax=Rathayibacter soli TaxID=3144168 RepID=UPI0027E48A76|nr:cation:proton antiporter [Glaciibacter superstes]
MSALMLMGLAAVLLWSLVAHRFERWGVAGPAVFVVLGAATTVWDLPAYAAVIDAPASEKVVEVILAIVLFVDATEVRGGIFGREPRVTLRLVLIALPLSLILAAVASALLIPESLLLIGVIACVIMPTDFAPAANILRFSHASTRVRQILNVESGYNDGLISPLFGMALPMAVALTTVLHAKPGENDDAVVGSNLHQTADAFLNAVPASVVAIVVGVVLGGVIGVAVRVLYRRGISNEAGVRFVMLLLPLIAYAIATIPVLNANGFVAAFVAGLMYRITRTRGQQERVIPHSELMLVDEIGVLTTSIVWFMLGGAALLAFTSGFDWRVLVLAVLALTVLRIVPVYFSLLGSSVGWRDRLLIGALGPRGTATIVFGLLAYNALPNEEGSLVLLATVMTVVGSVLLHGVAAPLVLRRIAPVGSVPATVAVE